MIEVKEIISDTKQQLLYGYDLTLDGEKIDQDSLNVIIDSLEIGLEMANKTHNKTHNKNKKYH